MLAVLRERTRAEHDAIEQTLGLLSDTLTLQACRRTLEQLHGFWQPVEQGLRRTVGLRELGLDAAEREKTPLLVGDLRVLMAEEPTGLPLCSDVPSSGASRRRLALPESSGSAP